MANNNRWGLDVNTNIFPGQNDNQTKTQPQQNMSTWGNLLGAGMGVLGGYLNQGSDDVTKTLNSPMNPFAKRAAGNMQDIANVGKGLAIAGPSGQEANFYNQILPMMAAQYMGANQMGLQNMQNIMGQGAQAYLPQEVQNMQLMRGQNPNAWMPGAQFDKANQALAQLAPAARSNLNTSLQQNYGNLLGGPTQYGAGKQITQQTAALLEADLAGKQQQQANTEAQAYQNAAAQRANMMNQIAGFQQHANQMAPQMQMMANQQVGNLMQQVPQFGGWLGAGTNTYLDRLAKAQALYNPLIGLKPTKQVGSQESGGNFWGGLMQGAGNALMNVGGSSNGGGWGDIFNKGYDAIKGLFS